MRKVIINPVYRFWMAVITILMTISNMPAKYEHYGVISTIGDILSIGLICILLIFMSKFPPSEVEPIEKVGAPNRPIFLIRLVKSPEETEMILGDLEEGFFYDIQKFSSFAAKLNFWKECISVFYEGAKTWILQQLPFVQTIMVTLEKIRRD